MPQGEFKGTLRLQKLFTASKQLMPDFKLSGTGNKLMVKGDRAFYEHFLEATIQGTKCKYLTICAYVSRKVGQNLGETPGCDSMIGI